MLYNLRADIIYYKSGSDFELEFNLCGCCRMRLLTDKPSSKKAFVHSLARAVSRSRVILIAGPLFGEENAVEIVSQALGTTTEIVDNNTYNISSEDEIEIIKGSLPLVSSDGSFGGCIIESGPQTMILLTDNKTLRKNIMSTLVHPYISDLYSAELQENNNAKEKNKPETEEVEEISTEIIDNTIDEKGEEPDIIEDIPLILTTDDDILDDINPEDIFFDEPNQEPEIEYEEDNDITIDDLFPSSPELEEPVRTIEEKIGESEIVLENEEEIKERELPEEYTNVFEKLFINDEITTEEDVKLPPVIPAGYTFLNDNGELLEESEYEFKKGATKLNIATIIITVILLISVIVLCYCIFSASSNEGMAPTEYIRSVWQTIFG